MYLKKSTREKISDNLSYTLQLKNQIDSRFHIFIFSNEFEKNSVSLTN